MVPGVFTSEDTQSIFSKDNLTFQFVWPHCLSPYQKSFVSFYTLSLVKLYLAISPCTEFFFSILCTVEDELFKVFTFSLYTEEHYCKIVFVFRRLVNISYFWETPYNVLFFISNHVTHLLPADIISSKNVFFFLIVHLFFQSFVPLIQIFLRHVATILSSYIIISTFKLLGYHIKYYNFT